MDEVERVDALVSCKRQTDAARWLIARAVNGTGLTVRTLEHEAMITDPQNPSNGAVRIAYAGGSVHRNGTCLGILDGYEPAGRRVGREEIIAALRRGQR
jgi:hypothetical protein